MSCAQAIKQQNNQAFKHTMDHLHTHTHKHARAHTTHTYTQHTFSPKQRLPCGHEAGLALNVLLELVVPRRYDSVVKLLQR